MSMIHHFYLIQRLAIETTRAGGQPVRTGIDAGSGS
jgi:hypothetical protein